MQLNILYSTKHLVKRSFKRFGGFHQSFILHIFQPMESFSYLMLKAVTKVLSTKIVSDKILTKIFPPMFCTVTRGIIFIVKFN